MIGSPFSAALAAPIEGNGCRGVWPSLVDRPAGQWRRQRRNGLLSPGSIWYVVPVLGSNTESGRIVQPGGAVL